MPDSAELRERLLSLMARGAAATVAEEEFNELALAVFHHQFAGNAPYRAFCESRGATPGGVEHWSEIPAVPTDAFKAAPLVVGDPEEAVAVFRTSGTTAGRERRGTHYVRDLAPYDAALRAGFAAHLLPDGARPLTLSLIPAPAELPDSSLSHMVEAVLQDLAAPDSGYFVTAAAGIDLHRLLPVLREAERAGTPVLLAGTSFAFVHLFDALAERQERFRLPAGTRIMDTGGFKGRSREVTREELLSLFSERLGVPPRWVVNEYGMTEMSSQFYDGVAGQAAESAAERLHREPGWVRTRAVDPETLAPLPDGEVGVLRHWDLGNLNSVMVLQTADLGHAGPDGFRLLGRARGAEARGCSIAMDELLEVIGER